MKSFIILSTFLLAFTAKAGVHIEPFLGYQAGEIKGDQLDNGDAKGSYIGGRLGYGVLGLSFGYDYTSGAMDFTRDSDDQELDYDIAEHGVFVAYELPILLRAYATYIFNAEGELSGGGETTKTQEGSGYKLGVGTTFLPFLAINVEYKVLTIDDQIDGSTTTSINNGEHKAYSLNISLPLDF